MKRTNNSKSYPSVVQVPLQAQAEFDAVGQVFQRQQREDLLAHVCKIEKSNKLLKHDIAKANDQLEKLQEELKKHASALPSELDKQITNLIELQLRQAQEEVREQFEINRRLQASLAHASLSSSVAKAPNAGVIGSIEQSISDGKKIYLSTCTVSGSPNGIVKLTLLKGGNSAKLAFSGQKDEEDGVVVSSEGKIIATSKLITPEIIACFELLLEEALKQIGSAGDEYSQDAFIEECGKLKSILVERKKWPFIGDINIKHKSKIPGYQCIWFEVDRVVTAHETLNNFNFRLSIAAVDEQGESNHPRLEFPEPIAGWTSLKSWYKESEDGYGPKLELRFETGGGHLDINVWDRMHSDDQLIVAVLLESLYYQLSALNEHWSSDFWSAAKWSDSIQRMIRILKSHRSVKFWTM